jgi:lipoyl(octanoyl) transferase
LEILVCDLGMIDYGEALKLQCEVVEARRQGLVSNTLLMLEHPAVLTKGTRTDAANIYYTDKQLAEAGIKVFEVNRGGDVTYHGPGQIVGYPIVDLKEFDLGIRVFINTMQEAIIAFLDDKYSIKGYSQKDKFTGVWVNDKKITAFGIAVVQGVSMHGFAFNVNTDLSHFDIINPCGLSKGVTSVANELGHEVDIEQTSKELAEYIVSQFGWEMKRIDLSELKEMTAAKTRQETS